MGDNSWLDNNISATINTTQVFKSLIGEILATTRLNILEKKKEKRKTVVDKFSALKGLSKKPKKASILPLIIIELIRPSKWKVKI